MLEELKHSVLKKRTWNAAELMQASELLDRCNAFEELDVPVSIEALEYRFGDEVNDFVWYAQDKLVGLLSLDDHGAQVREASGMVHPDYRRRGIARALLEAAGIECRPRGIERLVLVCERFSRSGQAFIAAIGAAYDFSEHRMQLGTLQTRGPYTDRVYLRVAEATDVDTLANLMTTSFGSSERRTREHVAHDLTHPKRRYFVALHEETPVGSLNLWTDKTVGIYAFNVLPQYRRRQFARQMLEQIIAMIRSETDKPITLEVDTTNTNAIALYRSCGFTETTTYGYYNYDLT